MPQEEESAITHHVVMVEEEPDMAIGVWFPDLPGCVSAGDTLDEAMVDVAEALALWVDVARAHGQSRDPVSITTESADESRG